MPPMENPSYGEHTDRMSLEQGDIAVVGAGVIGLMTALSLLDTGRDVTLIDLIRLVKAPPLVMLA